MTNKELPSVFAAAKQVPAELSFAEVQQIIQRLPDGLASTSHFTASLGKIGLTIVSLAVLLAAFTFWPSRREVEHHKQMEAPNSSMSTTFTTDTNVMEWRKEDTQAFIDAGSRSDTDQSLRAALPVAKRKVRLQKRKNTEHASARNVQKPEVNATDTTPGKPETISAAMEVVELEMKPQPPIKDEPACGGCNCDEKDVIRFNENLDAGYVVFYFSCIDEELGLGVSINKKDLKHLKRKLWRKLRFDHTIEVGDEVRLDFYQGVLLVNGSALPDNHMKAYLALLRSYGVEPAPNRKVLINDRQVWVGDFVNQSFYGSALGRNVRESLANEWLPTHSENE